MRTKYGGNHTIHLRVPEIHNRWSVHLRDVEGHGGPGQPWGDRRGEWVDRDATQDSGDGFEPSKEGRDRGGGRGAGLLPALHWRRLAGHRRDSGREELLCCDGAQLLGHSQRPRDRSRLGGAHIGRAIHHRRSQAVQSLQIPKKKKNHCVTKIVWIWRVWRACLIDGMVSSRCVCLM